MKASPQNNNMNNMKDSENFEIGRQKTPEDSSLESTGTNASKKKDSIPTKTSGVSSSVQPKTE